MVARKAYPSAQEVRALLDYDPATGVFTRRVQYAHSSTKVGDIAGTVHSGGYICIKVRRQKFYAHRLAWLHAHGEWPPEHIDHINGQKSDNRLCNLRLASPSQNCANQRIPANNTSGFKGVTFWKARQKWRADITKDQKIKYLGTFDTPEAAAAVYAAKAKELFGEFARTD